MLGRASDERVKRLVVRYILPAYTGEPGPDVFVEPDAVRRERVPQLPREAPAADVPIREDDRFAVATRDRLAQSKDRRTLVDQAHVAQDPEGAQGPPIVLPLDNDRPIAVLLREVLDRLLEVFVQLVPVRHGSSENGPRGEPGERIASVPNLAGAIRVVGRRRHISAPGYARCASRGGRELRARHEGVPGREREEDPREPRGGLLRPPRRVRRPPR